jgi:hypothetical protein
MRVVKGMVQVAGTTYRVVRVAQGSYEVVRILDDTHVGTFRSIPPVEIVPRGIEPALMLEIARAAIQGAKTSWVGRLSVA